MVSEPRNGLMAWMETDYSKHTHFQWKRKWRLKHLRTLGIIGETESSITDPSQVMYSGRNTKHWTMSADKLNIIK